MTRYSWEGVAMPQAMEQTEPYYELHRNFADRYRCRTARRLGVPAKTLVAYYAVAHDLASNAGTFGEFTTDVRAFEEAIGEPERSGTTEQDALMDAELAVIWRKLHDAGVVEIVSGDPEDRGGIGGLPGEFRVRVRGTAARPRKPPKSGAQRTAEYKARKRSSASGDDTSSPVTKGDDVASPVTTPVSGDVGVTGDADPSALPSALPSLRPSAQPLASAPAREAAPAAAAAAHPASAAGQAESTRKTLGPDLCRLVGIIVDHAREKHQRAIEPNTEHRNFMLPVLGLVQEHGHDAVIVAAEKAVARGAWSVKLISQILADDAAAAVPKAPTRVPRRGPALDPVLQAMFDAADPDAPESIARREAAGAA